MKIMLHTCIIVLLLLIAWNVYTLIRPNIFIISEEQFTDTEQQEHFLLQYAINGYVNQAYFLSSDACESYKAYLQTQGEVYDRKN